MIGYIRSFDREKQFGYIYIPETDQALYFHFRDCNQALINNLKDGLYVSFESTPTPEGYSAIKISKYDEQHFKYESPNKILISKSMKFNDWEIKDEIEWAFQVNGYSSPDEAKHALVSLCESCGATGIAQMQYTKGTGRSGNYNFTTHGYAGAPVVLLRKSITGQKNLHEFPDLNKRLEKKKAELISIVKKKNRVRLLCATLFAIFGFVVGGPIAAVISAALGAYLSRPRERHDWLERIQTLKDGKQTFKRYKETYSDYKRKSDNASVWENL